MQNATFAYPVHVALLNFTKESHRFLIDHGPAIARLLYVFSAAQVDGAKGGDCGNEADGDIVLLSDELHSINQRDESGMKLCLLHNAMEMIL